MFVSQRSWKLVSIFLGVLASTQSRAEVAEIAHYDVAALESAAAERGFTFTARTSWVTEYLQNGGDIANVTGAVVPLNWQESANFIDVKERADLPEAFDWREQIEGGLQAARNQGSCGSCWAFSVTSVLEGLNIIQNPTSRVDFSEQAVLSCSRAGSCSGGYFNAFNYLKTPGVADEAQFPYRASNLSCKSSLSPKGKLAKWAYVSNEGKALTTEQLKTAIYTYGPISVTVNGSFSGYGSGVYNNCNYGSINHMVTLEGWNEADGGYWIMRNSWGTNWGEDGYMRIRYTDRNGRKCNRIGETAAFAVLEVNGPSR